MVETTLFAKNARSTPSSSRDFNQLDPFVWLLLLVNLDFVTNLSLIRHLTALILRGNRELESYFK
jgi:hypothetical protein